MRSPVTSTQPMYVRAHATCPYRNLSHPAHARVTEACQRAPLQPKSSSPLLSVPPSSLPSLARSAIAAIASFAAAAVADLIPPPPPPPSIHCLVSCHHPPGGSAASSARTSVPPSLRRLLFSFPLNSTEHTSSRRVCELQSCAHGSLHRRKEFWMAYWLGGPSFPASSSQRAALVTPYKVTDGGGEGRKTGGGERHLQGETAVAAGGGRRRRRGGARHAMW